MPQPPRVIFNFEVDEPIEDTEVVVEDDFSDNDEQSVEEDILPDRVQSPPQREKITDDIFENIPSQIISDLESKINKAKPTKKTQKPKDPNKPKRKSNPEHMAKMRAKAAETRERKKREKEEKLKLETEEKQLMNAKKKIELEKMKKELNGESEPEPPPKTEPKKEPATESKPPTNYKSSFTQEDLAKAQFEAIIRYETLRKDRKAKKRAAQKEERDKKELMDKLTGKRTNQPGRVRNIYDGCY